MNMVALCPYCKDELRVEMTAQFIDRVDESVMSLYTEEFERMQKRAAALGGMQGRMMRMAAGMAKGMQGQAAHMMRGMIEYPPLVTILKCMSCDAVLSIKMQSSGNSD